MLPQAKFKPPPEEPENGPPALRLDVWFLSIMAFIIVDSLLVFSFPRSWPSEMRATLWVGIMAFAVFILASFENSRFEVLDWEEYQDHLRYWQGIRDNELRRLTKELRAQEFTVLRVDYHHRVLDSATTMKPQPVMVMLYCLGQDEEWLIVTPVSKQREKQFRPGDKIRFPELGCKYAPKSALGYTIKWGSSVQKVLPPA